MMTEDEELECYMAFVQSRGYGWPVEKNSEYFAEKLWDDSPGECFRAGWSAGRSYQMDRSKKKEVSE